MSEAPARSKEKEVPLENLEFINKRLGGFGGRAIYYKYKNKYYPQITDVENQRFFEWGVKNDDVLLSATYGKDKYDFGDARQFEGKDKFFMLEAFKKALQEKAKTGTLSRKTLKGITLTLLRNAERDKTQTASPLSPQKSTNPPAAKLKLYVISSNAP